MLARFLWPLQRLALRSRWVIDIAILLYVAVLAGMAMMPTAQWGDFSTTQRVALGGAVVAIWYAAGRVGLALSGFLIIGIAVVTAMVGQSLSAAHITVLVAPLAAMLLPVLYEVRSARTHAEVLQASALTAVVPVIGALFTVPAWYIMGGGWLVSGGLIGAASMLVIPLTWSRLPADDLPVVARPLLPRVQSIQVAGTMQAAVLVLVALGCVDVGFNAYKNSDQTLAPWLWLSPFFLLFLWHAVTGRFLQGIAIVVVSLGWLGYAFFNQSPRHDDKLLIDLSLAHILPLSLWLARTRHRRWPSLLLLAICVLTALSVDQHAIPIGGAALASCLAVVVCAPRNLPALPVRGIVPADEALLRVRRGCQRLLPYWRHYGTAKLRFDPVYRQLCEQTLPWGRVLDVGCGPGLVAGLAAVRGEPSYLGIDLDRDKLETAQDLLERLQQPLGGDWQLMMAQVPLPQDPPNRFDSIMVIDVLHYWPRDVQGAVLTQLQHALAPGGSLWVRDGAGDAAGKAGKVGFSEVLTTFFGLNPGTSGLHFLTRDDFIALCAEAGLDVREELPSGAENRLWRLVRSKNITQPIANTEDNTSEQKPS